MSMKRKDFTPKKESESVRRIDNERSTAKMFLLEKKGTCV